MFWLGRVGKRVAGDPVRLGDWGEKHSLKFLKKKGLHFVARNYSCLPGEIDLVMADRDGALVFVEVKTRSGEKVAPAESAVGAAKRVKLVKASRWFMREYGLDGRAYRFDIVAIVVDEDRGFEVRHWENAFVP